MDNRPDEITKTLIYVLEEFLAPSRLEEVTEGFTDATVDNSLEEVERLLIEWHPRVLELTAETIFNFTEPEAKALPSNDNKLQKHMLPLLLREFGLLNDGFSLVPEDQAEAQWARIGRLLAVEHFKNTLGIGSKTKKKKNPHLREKRLAGYAVELISLIQTKQPNLRPITREELATTIHEAYRWGQDTDDVLYGMLSSIFGHEIDIAQERKNIQDLVMRFSFKEKDGVRIIADVRKLADTFSAGKKYLI